MNQAVQIGAMLGSRAGQRRSYSLRGSLRGPVDADYVHAGDLIRVYVLASSPFVGNVGSAFRNNIAALNLGVVGAINAQSNWVYPSWTVDVSPRVDYAHLQDVVNNVLHAAYVSGVPVDTEQSYGQFVSRAAVPSSAPTPTPSPAYPNVGTVGTVIVPIPSPTATPGAQSAGAGSGILDSLAKSLGVSTSTALLIGAGAALGIVLIASKR